MIVTLQCHESELGERVLDMWRLLNATLANLFLLLALPIASHAVEITSTFLTSSTGDSDQSPSRGGATRCLFVRLRQPEPDR